MNNMHQKFFTFFLSILMASMGILNASDNAKNQSPTVGSKITFRRPTGFIGPKIKLGKRETGIFLGTVKSLYKLDKFDSTQASIVQYISDIAPMTQISSTHVAKSIKQKFIDDTDNVYCIKPDDTSKNGFFNNVDCVLVHKSWFTHKGW